jgi:hypothetical protein
MGTPISGAVHGDVVVATGHRLGGAKPNSRAMRHPTEIKRKFPVCFDAVGNRNLTFSLP